MRPGASGDLAQPAACTDGEFSLRLVPSLVFEAPPHALVLGDVNGDGRTDLVATLRSVNAVDIALGNGDGSFVLGSRLHPAGQPAAAVIADFDGDGKADVATISTQPDVMGVFWGNGDGTFRGGPTYPTGPEPFEILVADSNGDGAPDLVVRGSQTLDHWLNRGDGAFLPRSSLANSRKGLAPYATMAAGDFNGDGRDDLAVANGDASAGLGVYLAKVDGTFDEATISSTGHFYESVAVGDLNGDGWPDLAALYPGVVMSLLNRGDGTFVDVVGDSAHEGSVLLGDVDGDGFPDLLVGDDDSRYVWISRNRGDGTFEELSGYDSEEEPNVVAAGDVNGDGRADLTLGSWSVPVVDVVLAAPGGVFAGETPGLMMAYTLGLGDLNADGQLDVILAHFWDASPVVLTIWLGRKDGTFTRGVELPLQELPRSIETSDLNGDGKLDVMALYDHGRPLQTEQLLQVYLGRGDGSLADPIESFHAGSRGVLGIGDLNGDNRGDLVLCDDYSFQAGVSLGQGNGTFLAPVSYSVADRCGWEMALADLNGDGHLDLCVTTYGPGIVILPGRGDGTFSAASFIDTLRMPFSMRIADVTGDGRLDLVATTDTSGTIGIVAGRGDGTFGAWMASPTAFEYGDIVGIADLDDDGVPDVVVSDGARLHVLLGQGDGHFTIGPVHLLPDSGDRPIIADLNGDGRPDIGRLIQVNGALQWDVLSNQRCRP